MSKSKKKKRNRKKRNHETREEKLIRMAKSRGGRGTMTIPDKKKYNRKKDKFKSSDYSGDFLFYINMCVNSN